MRTATIATASTSCGRSRKRSAGPLRSTRAATCLPSSSTASVTHSRTPHPTHAHLDAVLGWARELRVGRVYLVHMGNGLDYHTLIAELPDWAAPAYDGLEIVL